MKSPMGRATAMGIQGNNPKAILLGRTWEDPDWKRWIEEDPHVTGAGRTEEWVELCLQSNS